LPLTVSEGESLDEMYDQVIDDLLDVLVPPVPVKI
ncbi:zinc ABC transporter substrate-binding protein, partial [Vibrio parahaemolyticus]|nr:zinc ABC transporter substrate-binding protein [Vibrio parahaemolyticus]